MICVKSFTDELIKKGIKHFTGVPCSYMNPIFDEIHKRKNISYYAASSEGEALVIASGIWLGGEKCAVMCQNSGLGNMVNPLTSLNEPFAIPVLLLIPWRGQPGEIDEPQHSLMGSITTQLLDLLNIDWMLLPKDNNKILDHLEYALNKMQISKKSYALLIEKDSFTTYRKEENKIQANNLSNLKLSLTNSLPARNVILKSILDHVSTDYPIIATTGKTGRELYTLSDKVNHLYCVGSMGYANALATGLALSTLNKTKILVIDGDGAAIMHLGNFTTIGALKVTNLIHIVLDNGSYESTGGQTTSSNTVNFVKLAKSVGYKYAKSFNSAEAFIKALKVFLKVKGPVLIHIKICVQSLPNLGRPSIKPRDIAIRLRNFVKCYSHR